MYPILFQIGDLIVTSFGALLTLAFVVFIIGIIRFAPRRGLTMKFFSEHIVSLTLGSFLGAKLLYWIVQFQDIAPFLTENVRTGRFLPTFKLLFNIEQFYVLGGIIIFLLLFVFFAKRHKEPVLPWLDCIVPAFLIGFAIANVGSFLGGYYVGAGTDSFLGMRFGLYDPASLEASLSYASQIASSIPIHPIQLYMAAASFILFLITRELLKKMRSPGVVTVVGSVLFSIVVFLVEFLRNPDDRIFYILWLDINQWAAIAGVVLAVTLFLTKVPRIRE